MKKVETNELDGLLSPKLREILQAEIKSGSKVRGACFGGFTNGEDRLFVFLERPFPTEIRTGFPGISYTVIDAPSSTRSHRRPPLPAGGV